MLGTCSPICTSDIKMVIRIRMTQPVCLPKRVSYIQHTMEYSDSLRRYEMLKDSEFIADNLFQLCAKINDDLISPDILFLHLLQTYLVARAENEWMIRIWSIALVFIVYCFDNYEVCTIGTDVILITEIFTQRKNSLKSSSIIYCFEWNCDPRVFAVARDFKQFCFNDH